MVEYQKAAADSLAAVFFMEEKIAVLRRLYKEVVSNSDARGHRYFGVSNVFLAVFKCGLWVSLSCNMKRWLKYNRQIV